MMYYCIILESVLVFLEHNINIFPSGSGINGKCEARGHACLSHAQDNK